MCIWLTLSSMWRKDASSELMRSTFMRTTSCTVTRPPAEVTTGESRPPGRLRSKARRDFRRHREVGEESFVDPSERLLIGGLRHLRRTILIHGPQAHGVEAGGAGLDPDHPAASCDEPTRFPLRGGDEPTTSSAHRLSADGKLDADIGEMTRTTAGRRARRTPALVGEWTPPSKYSTPPMTTGAKYAGIAHEARTAAASEARRRTGPTEHHAGAVISAHRRDPEILRPPVANEAMKRSSARRRGQSCRPGASSWRPHRDGSSTAAWRSSTGARAMGGATV